MHRDKITDFRQLIQSKAKIEKVFITEHAEPKADCDVMVLLSIKDDQKFTLEMARKVVESYHSATFARMELIRGPLPVEMRTFIDLMFSRGVIVLGRNSKKDVEELEMIRDYVAKQGYRAALIKDIRDI